MEKIAGKLPPQRHEFQLRQSVAICDRSDGSIIDFASVVAITPRHVRTSDGSTWSCGGQRLKIGTANHQDFFIRPTNTAEIEQARTVEMIRQIRQFQNWHKLSTMDIALIHGMMHQAQDEYGRGC